MLTIERTTAFKRGLKGRYRAILDTELRQIIVDLATGRPLEFKHCDHRLSNNWKGYRDCHVRPDLVLIYRIDVDSLILARLGSHSRLDLRS